MDIEHHFQAVEKQAQTDQDPLANTTTTTSSGCFNCNICLDSAQDPIVTLCGHLYCWPCLYKWMNHKEASPQQCPVCKGALSLNTLVPLYGRGGDTSKNSQSKGSNTTNSAIPQRPSAHRVDAPPTLPQQQDSPQQLHLQYQYPQDPLYRNHVTESSPPLNFGGSPPRVPHPTSGAFGGMVISMLPWVFGNSEPGLHYSNAYYQMGIANNPRVRRQDMKTERSLNRISAFLFCCLVMCLLLF